MSYSPPPPRLTRVFFAVQGRPISLHYHPPQPQGGGSSLSDSSSSLTHKKKLPGQSPQPPSSLFLPEPTMLHKLFQVHKLARLSRPDPPKPVYLPDQDASSALKIVHAGGKVECYFMPIPAARIIEKYPSFYVTRPEVFRRPWEAVVGPDATLALGEKYFLVPRHTVKQLRRRTRRPSRDDRSADDLSLSRSFSRAAGRIKRNGGDSSGSFVKWGDRSDGSDASAEIKVYKTNASAANKKHVRFRGIIDEKPRKGPSMAAAVAAERKHGKMVESVRKGAKKKTQSGGGENRKVKVTPTWQPALASITETNGSDE